MQLVRKADGNETDYKFHRAIKLGAGEETTVWASEAGTTHDAPHNLVMKGQTWFVADKMTTTLYDMEGEVRLPRRGGVDREGCRSGADVMYGGWAGFWD